MHQPDGLILPSTTLQLPGARNWAQPSHRCSPLGLSWYLAWSLETFDCCAATRAQITPPAAANPAPSSARRPEQIESFISIAPDWDETSSCRDARASGVPAWVFQSRGTESGEERAERGRSRRRGSRLQCDVRETPVTRLPTLRAPDVEEGGQLCARGQAFVRQRIQKVGHAPCLGKRVQRHQSRGGQYDQEDQHAAAERAVCFRKQVHAEEAGRYRADQAERGDDRQLDDGVGLSAQAVGLEVGVHLADALLDLRIQ